MKSIFSTYVNKAALSVWLFVFRVSAGAAMLTHGWPKLTKLMAGNVQFADPIGIGAGASLVLVVFAEALCSILIILGLGTRLAAIPLIITMLVAALITHASDPFGKKELSFVYLLIFITLAVTGAGRYSLDAVINNKSILKSPNY